LEKNKYKTILYSALQKIYKSENHISFSTRT